MQRRTVIEAGMAFVLRAQIRPAPTFEVASIRRYAVSGPPPQGTADGPPPPPPPPILKPAPGGLTIENATLKYCLVWAYSVRNSQVSGPSWINEMHYNIAKTGAPVEIAQLKEMLQNLPNARFRLVLRRDTKERSVLGIVTAKGGSKLAPSKPGTVASQQLTPVPGGSLRIDTKNTGLDFLEQILSFPVWEPVVNLTGLTGGFDFTFERTPFRGQPDEILSELNAAIQRQLGGRRRSS